MVAKETRWHQTVKEVLKEIGEDRRYDISESNSGMIDIFSSSYPDFGIPNHFGVFFIYSI